MLIEIRNAGFVNKGAELMLYAVWQVMKKSFPEAEFVMAPTVKRAEAPYLKRAEMGFLQKAWLWRYGVQWGGLAALAPRDIREMFGVVLDREIDIVLDASGFSYTDQWGTTTTRELALSCRRWHKHGTKVILLPQAFGPFSKGKSGEWMKIAVDNADLIFARDPISYQNLVDAVGDRPKVRMAPDFTNLIEGELPDNFDKENMKFCIVPNYRMIDKTSKEQSEAYQPVEKLINQGIIGKLNSRLIFLRRLS
jgi:colanic acid/amylovoran biosynthesis protein